MERWKLLTFWNYPISADIVECEDINILNNSESRGTSDEGFVMNLEEQAIARQQTSGKPYAMKVARTVWGGVMLE